LSIKHYVYNIALEAESYHSITYHRPRILQKTGGRSYKKLQNNSISQNSTHPETRTLRSIQAKFKNNNAMITAADKNIHIMFY